MSDAQPQLLRSKYGSNKNFVESRTVAPILADVRPPPMATLNENAVIPGAREDRKPIIQNVLKHHRKTSDGLKQIGNFDGSV